MDEKSLLDFGKRLSKAVQDAVNTKDFTNLNSFINQTVHSVTGTVTKTVHSVTKTVHSFTGEPFREDAPPEGRNPRPYNPQGDSQRQPENTRRWGPPPGGKAAGQWNRPSAAPYQPPMSRPYSPLGRPVRRHSSGSVGTLLLVLGLVFGVPLTLGWGISSLITLVGGAFRAAKVISAVLLPLMAATGGMTVAGLRLRKRNKRYLQYQQQLQGCKFYSIRQLAAGSGYTEAFVRKDLKKMIRLRMFQDAFLDDQETCIILDSETYGQYRQSLENMKRRQAEETQRKEQAPADPEAEKARQVVEEGLAYIRQIKEANEAIPGEVVSQKLTRLEQISTKVFLYVQERPKKLPQLRNFIDYYLPTTLKLVNAYRDFDQQPVQGENISAAKQNIESMLDTINDAFENLFDNLFEDDFIDINADISTMETLLRQDGLTSEGLGRSKEHKEREERQA